MRWSKYVRFLCMHIHVRISLITRGPEAPQKRTTAKVPSAVPQMDAAEPDYDVAVNVNKHATDGYGIYFTSKDGIIRVTKLDKNSEADRAGVQPNDELIRVQDLDGKLPAENPGAKVDITPANYQATLGLVRNMKYCRLEFRTPAF